MSSCACGVLYSVGSLNPLPGKVAQCHIKAVVFGNIRGEQSVHVVFPIPAHTHTVCRHTWRLLLLHVTATHKDKYNHTEPVII